MHMASALISTAVSGTMFGASGGSIGFSAYKNQHSITKEKIPMMASLGALVFAGQMINYTIPGTGSSGHIGGGILLAALLGPFPAMVTISVVLLVQCLFFADGGLAALGCNIFNMGVLPCLVAFPIYKAFVKKKMSMLSIAVGSFISVVVGLQFGAFGVVMETTLSGITDLSFGEFFSLMQPIHLAIGAVEGLATAVVLCLAYKFSPDAIKSVLNNESSDYGYSKNVTIWSSIAAVIIAGLFSKFASGNPDGLEWAINSILGSESIGEVKNSYEQAILNFTAIMPDYTLGTSPLSTSFAGIIGTIVTFGCVALLALIISPKKKVVRK